MCIHIEKKYNKLNCMICNPDGPINKCECENSGKCDLCLIFKPLCKKIDECCEEILNKK